MGLRGSNADYNIKTGKNKYFIISYIEETIISMKKSFGLLQNFGRHCENFKCKNLLPSSETSTLQQEV